MGEHYFDQYTYLHFAVGVVVYYYNVPFLYWLILHTIFEIVENTHMGMYIINTYMGFWPGGKPKADTIKNCFGDTLGAVLGWLSAYYVDKVGNKYGWYQLHGK